MSDPVSYEMKHGIATIVMDDGKVNVMTPRMIGGLSEAFAEAQEDRAVVVLAGRELVFSAGYDMARFDQTIESIAATIRAGGELVEQILSHPFPVVAACTGHAIAQGAFTLLACDVRVGPVDGAQIGLNEVAIGLTIPHYGIEIARHQLVSPWFDRATVSGTLFSPEQALTAGFFHHLVDPSDVVPTAIAHANQLMALDMTAHTGTKQRVRRPVLEAIRTGLLTEFTPGASAEPASENAASAFAPDVRLQ